MFGKLKHIFDSAASMQKKNGRALVEMLNSIVPGAPNMQTKIDKALALVKAGADLTVTDNRGWNVMILLCKDPYDMTIDVLKEALARKPDLTRRCPIGQTAFDFAASIGFEYERTDKLDLLLQAGYDINTTDTEKSTALHGATKMALVKYLLSHGADLNRQDMDGNTPMMRFAKNGWTDFIAECVKYKHNPTLRNNNGHTALDLALNLHPACIELLQASADHWDASNKNAVLAKDTATVKRVVFKGSGSL